MRNEGWYEMRAAEGGREPEGGAALPPAPRGGDWAAGGGGGRAGAGPEGEGRRARGGAVGPRPGGADPSARTRPPPLPGDQTFPWISRPRLSSSSRSPPVPAFPGRVPDCLSQELKTFLITGVGGRGGVLWVALPPSASPAGAAPHKSLGGRGRGGRPTRRKGCSLPRGSHQRTLAPGNQEAGTRGL